eukprot:3451076-Prymnesium_polylepis.1
MVDAEASGLPLSLPGIIISDYTEDRTELCRIKPVPYTALMPRLPSEAACRRCSRTSRRPSPIETR